MVMPYKLVSPLKILQMILFQIRDESRYNFGLKVKIFGECLVKSHKHKVEEMIQNVVHGFRVLEKMIYLSTL